MIFFGLLVFTNMKHVSKMVSLTILLAALVGCTSTAEQERQIAERERQQQEANRRAVEEGERVRANWSRLRQGMTIEEVEAAIGPLDPEWKKDVLSTPSVGSALGMRSERTATYMARTYTLQFTGGKLSAWTLKK